MITEDKIKKPILSIMAEESIACLIVSNDSPPLREYPLKVDFTVFKSDFKYRTHDAGWLFIEDDDGKRCLGNFSKYWLWLSMQENIVPVYLIHIIGPGEPGQRKILEFLKIRAIHEFPNFKYEIIYTTDWSDVGWQEEFRVKLKSLLLRSPNAP